MLGNRGGKQYGMTLDVTLPDGEDLPVRLDAAVGALAGQVVHAGLGWQPRRSSDPDPVDLTGGLDPAEDGAYTWHPDGTVTQQRDGCHHQVRADPELVSLIRLKTAARALFAAEADEQMGNNERQRIRQGAMRRYQEYTAAYGWLGRSDLTTRPDPDNDGGVIVVRARPSKMGGFRQDPWWTTVLALEVWNDELLTGTPAPILTTNVGARPKRKDHTSDPAEALALTLDEAGQVDLAVCARILQCEEAEVPGLLGPLIWQDPGHEDGAIWVTADEYLSGNVRVKLAAAKKAEEAHEAVTGVAGRWAGNIAALEAVQPEDLPPRPDQRAARRALAPPGGGGRVHR